MPYGASFVITRENGHRKITVYKGLDDGGVVLYEGYRTHRRPGLPWKGSALIPADEFGPETRIFYVLRDVCLTGKGGACNWATVPVVASWNSHTYHEELAREFMGHVRGSRPVIARIEGPPVYRHLTGSNDRRSVQVAQFHEFDPDQLEEPLSDGLQDVWQAYQNGELTGAQFRLHRSCSQEEASLRKELAGRITACWL